MVVVTGTSRSVILDAVRRMYADVAREPRRGFHFPTGRGACEAVGYCAEMLEDLPESVVESFAGVGNPWAADVVRDGQTVLDIGAGSGTDAFVAARGVGPRGRVLALDLTGAMRVKLRRNLRDAGIANVHVLGAEAERLPLRDACTDVVTSNGVLNLVPDKPRAVREIARVLRPGGRLQIADIVLGRRAPEACREEPELWAECIVGATTEASYLELFRRAGFRDVDKVADLDYFALSTSAGTREVAESLGARAIVFRAVRAGPLPDRIADPQEEEAVEELHEAPDDLRHDDFFDAGGLSCGDAIPPVRRALRALEPGRVLAVRTTDRAAAVELPAWCRMTGNAYLGSSTSADADLHFIRRDS